jgi:outer membrane biosynthesis protein TonB
MRMFTAGFVSEILKQAAKPKAKAKPKVVSKPKPKPSAKPTPKPKAKVTAKPKPKAKPAAKPAAKAPAPAAAGAQQPMVDKMELGRAAQTLAGLYKNSPIMAQMSMRTQLTSSLFKHLSATPEGSRIAINALNRVGEQGPKPKRRKKR